MIFLSDVLFHNMTPIQIILLIIIGTVVAKTAQKYAKRAITVREFFLWAAFWLFGAVLVVFPNATQTVANFVGIGRGVDLLIYGALIILFVTVFFALVRVERLERDVTYIVRHLALKKKVQPQPTPPKNEVL